METEETKELSDVMEERRLWIESAERLSEERVVEKDGFCRWGKKMSASERGYAMAVGSLRFSM